jgi:hypothetical protein
MTRANGGAQPEIFWIRLTALADDRPCQSRHRGT